MEVGAQIFMQKQDEKRSWASLAAESRNHPAASGRGISLGIL